MKTITILVIILGTFVLTSLAVGLFQLQLNPPLSSSQTTSMKVIGWIPNWDQESAIQSYYQNVSHFQYISVFWYTIDTHGTLMKYENTNEDLSVISFAHSHHQKVFALVANLTNDNGNPTWDPNRVDKVISSENGRQKHIADLMHLVKAKNFDGIDIDYESLHAYQKNDFSMFIQELAQALHKDHKLLGVAVYPPHANESNTDYGLAAQDLPVLATAADQLYFMTYLEHTLSSPPGPTGSIPWMQSSLEYAINSLHIPTQKIFMGIGLMGTAWRQNSDGSIDGDKDDLTFQEIQMLAANNNITPTWGSSSQSPRLEFTDQNGKHIIWYENAQSIAHKIALAQKFHVGGIALWRLGGEDPAVWKLI